jgi:hypothetical protein
MSSSELSVVSSPSSYLPRCYIRTSAQHTCWTPSIPESRGAAKPTLRAWGGRDEKKKDGAGGEAYGRLRRLEMEELSLV